MSMRFPEFFVQFGDPTSVTYNGREVENRALRVLVAAVALIGGALSVCLGMLAVALGMLAVALVLVTLPATFPVHLLLRRLGRRGFVESDGRAFGYNLSLDGFKREADESPGLGRSAT